MLPSSFQKHADPQTFPMSAYQLQHAQLTSFTLFHAVMTDSAFPLIVGFAGDDSGDQGLGIKKDLGLDPKLLGFREYGLRTV